MTTYSDLYDPTKTLEEIKEEILNNVSEVDEMIDTGNGTPMMNIVDIVAKTAESINEMSLAMYADQSPYTASLPALINVFGELYGVAYQAGVNTQQMIRLQITQPCNIYAETTVEHTQFQISDNKGNIYVPVTDHYFTASEIGYQDIQFQSLEVDAIKSDINTITNILTTTLGIISCNNPTTYTILGTPTETTETYRKRILKASRFYKTTGSALSIEDQLRNDCCDDAFIYKNYSSTTQAEVASGAICVIEKSDDTEITKAKIAKILMANIQSAYMYSFPAVPDPLGNCQYGHIICDVTGHLHDWQLLSNGCLKIKIGTSEEEKDNLDFTTATSLQDVCSKLNALAFNNVVWTYTTKDITIGTVTTTHHYITATSTIEGENGTLTFEDPTGTGTDMRAIDLLNYAGALKYNRPRKPIVIADGADYAEERYIATLYWNHSVSVPVKIRLKYSSSDLTEGQKTITKEQLISKLTSNGIIKIYNKLTSMDVMPLLKEIVEEQNFSGFFEKCEFLRYDDFYDPEQTITWDNNVVCKHVYEIQTVSENDISFEVF